jgi:hypothetical protein
MESNDRLREPTMSVQTHRSPTTVTLARRLQLIRRDLFGEDGTPILARLVGVPTQTWTNYESGVVIPGTILLQFIATTKADPYWLLTGDGEALRPNAEQRTQR